MSGLEDTIAVPRRLIAELAALLEREPGPSVTVPGGNGNWTEAMVHELRLELAAYPGATAALDVAARNAGQLVAFEAVEQECKLPSRQIAAELGAMTKAVRRL